MSDDIPDHPKKEWYDGVERVCSGSVVEMKTGSPNYGRRLVVHETPKEVNEIMQANEPEAMLELHHHGDPSICVYVRNQDVSAIDVRWDIVED